MKTKLFLFSRKIHFVLAFAILFSCSEQENIDEIKNDNTPFVTYIIKGKSYDVSLNKIRDGSIDNEILKSFFLM